MMPWSHACETLDLRITHAPEEVKSAFRLAVRRTHPDQTGTRDTEPMFVRVVEAYERLTTHRNFPDGRAISEPRTCAVDIMAQAWRDWIERIYAFVERELFDSFEPLSRIRFVRKDVDGCAHVKIVCEQRQGDAISRSVTRFSFESGKEPPHYWVYVRTYGEPSRIGKQHLSKHVRVRSPSTNSRDVRRSRLLLDGRLCD